MNRRGWTYVPCQLAARELDREREALFEQHREIAERERRLEESQRLYERASAALAARNDLLSVVTHELKNYLSTLMMSTSLLSLMEANVRPDMARAIDAIRRAATRMEHLVGNLRDATVVETGQLAVSMCPTDVELLIEDTLATFQPEAAARSLRLSALIERPLALVHCDRERVFQVLSNLLNNAFKFTAAGGAIRIAAASMPGGIRVSVADTGAGISASHLPHIFERHWRADRSSTASWGLGLFIAKAIVTAQGGQLWVESELGVGSTFSFTLLSAPSAATGPIANRSDSSGPSRG